MIKKFPTPVTRSQLHHLYSCLLTMTLILVFLNLPAIGFSQVIKGVVVDNYDNQIPYASIGIVNGNYGTISNDKGVFSLEMSKIKLSDTLRFSSVGYYSKDILIRDINKLVFQNIILDKKTYSINEVEIHPNSKKPVKFGKRVEHYNGWAYGGVREGCELARLFTNSKIITLKEFQFHIRHSEYDSILFRLNIYSNMDGTPDQIINRAPIYIKSDIKEGWIKKELSEYNISTDEDFFVSFEAIEGWQTTTKIDIFSTKLIISGKYGKGETYRREYFQGDWTSFGTLVDYYLIAHED